MDKFWNITIDFLTKINQFIPLVAVLWAGIGVLGIVLILGITGCVLRKRLVPQWLIWSYFICATIIIFAQANNDIFNVVAYMEVPCLVVLLAYLLRLVFYRRPRYTYVERTVYAREIDKTPVVKNVAEKVETPAVEKATLEEVKEEIEAVKSNDNEVVAEAAEATEETEKDETVEESKAVEEVADETQESETVTEKEVVSSEEPAVSLI